MSSTWLALIAESQDWDKIAEGDYTPELHAALTAAADDWTDSNEGCDYWGEDDNGGWRVILGRGWEAEAEAKADRLQAQAEAAGLEMEYPDAIT